MESIFSSLSEIFSAVFERPGLVVSAEMKTGDIDGWDSFKNVEILIACEARWGFRFSSREIDRIRTLGDLAACIASKIAAD